jgi:hypothetical protein
MNKWNEFKLKANEDKLKAAERQIHEWKVNGQLDDVAVRKLIKERSEDCEDLQSDLDTMIQAAESTFVGLHVYDKHLGYMRNDIRCDKHYHLIIGDCELTMIKSKVAELFQDWLIMRKAMRLVLYMFQQAKEAEEYNPWITFIDHDNDLHDYPTTTTNESKYRLLTSKL